MYLSDNNFKHDNALTRQHINVTTFFTQFNSLLYGATNEKILSNIVKSSEKYHR